MKGKRNRKVLAIAVAAIAAVLALCLTLGFTVPVKTMDILVFQNTEDSVTLIVSNHTPTQEDSLGLQVDGGVVAQEIFTEYLPRELGEAEPENALAAYEVMTSDGTYIDTNRIFQDYGLYIVTVSAPLFGGDYTIFYDTVDLKDASGNTFPYKVIVKGNGESQIGPVVPLYEQ